MKQASAGISISLVSLPWARSFVSRFAHYLDGFEEFPGFEGLPERGFDQSRMETFVARSRSFDVAIQLHGDGSVTNRFLPRLRPRLTAGFYPAGQPCPDPARFIPYPWEEHEIRRLLKLMRHLGIPSAGEDLEFPLTHRDHHEAHRIATAGGLQAGQFVCLHAGARDPKRRWPPENFLQVAKGLAARGLRIVLTGTAEEADQTAILRERLGACCLDLTGKTGLGALAALLKKARLLISNDTGVSHLAAALQVPSVVVFSASDPRRWAPLDTTRHRALGGPIASPAVQATPAAVLREAFSLLSESPLRVEARGGGFPVLPEVNWSRVKRVLLIHDGSAADLVVLAPAVAALRSRWPALTLLTSPAAAGIAPLLPGIKRLIVADCARVTTEGAARDLVDQLRSSSFDAAIIFTRPLQNPFTTGYLCYLAGIPIRVGASKEFGGALLSHWVRKLPESLDAEERHLGLLRAVGLPSFPPGLAAGSFDSLAGGRPDAGLTVPPAVQAATKVALHEAGIEAGCPLVLMDSREGNWEGAELVADQIRDTTGMTVVPPRGFRPLSAVESAALVWLSELVITPDPLISRVADAFGRPLVATGPAVTHSDGWRPRRSFSKLLPGPQVSQDDLLHAVRTLLWLPPLKSEPIAATTFVSNFTLGPGTWDN